uniref:Uncharacterized protein n=1 Tax=Caulobacter phage BL57 TaxID=3348355 RepID=A0AB74UGT5_9VIRU
MVSAYQKSLQAQAMGLTTKPDLLAKGYWVAGKYKRNSLSTRIKAYIERRPEVRFVRRSELGETFLIHSTTPVNHYLPVTDQATPRPPFGTSDSYTMTVMNLLVTQGCWR